MLQRIQWIKSTEKHTQERNHTLVNNANMKSLSWQHFSCSECEKKFAQTRGLELHERVHTEEKPFPCPTCHKRFGQKGTIPLWTMQQQIQPFKSTEKHVQERNHTLVNNANMKSLSWKHFSCSECEKRFAQTRGLELHERVHTGESLILVPHATRYLDVKEDFNFKWEPTLGRECQHALREQVICLCWGVWNAETIYML